jgi:hypothetical protein
MLGNGFFSELVETARFGVALDLPVPQFLLELREPIRELANLFVRQRGDFLFDFFELGHDPCLTQIDTDCHFEARRFSVIATTGTPRAAAGCAGEIVSLA